MLFSVKFIALIAAFAAQASASTSKPAPADMGGMDMSQPSTAPGTNDTTTPTDASTNTTTPAAANNSTGTSGPTVPTNGSALPSTGAGGVPGDMSTGQCMCPPVPQCNAAPGLPSPSGSNPGGPVVPAPTPVNPSGQPAPANPGVVSPIGTSPGGAAAPSPNPTPDNNGTTDSGSSTLRNSFSLAGLMTAGAVALAL